MAWTAGCQLYSTVALLKEPQDFAGNRTRIHSDTRCSCSSGDPLEHRQRRPNMPGDGRQIAPDRTAWLHGSMSGRSSEPAWTTGNMWTFACGQTGTPSRKTCHRWANRFSFRQERNVRFGTRASHQKAASFWSLAARARVCLRNCWNAIEIGSLECRSCPPSSGR